MQIGEDNTARFAASVRLPLAGFTAKVGAGFRQYPRADGVLVPRALATLTPGLASHADVAELPSPQAARLRLGRAVVSEVARVMRTLPAEVLALPLPAPSQIIARSGIEHRTRNVVERLAPFETTRPWSVARYLQIPRFGPRCLTDLLAAHDESSRPPGPAETTAHAGEPRPAGTPSDAVLVGLARRLRGRAAAHGHRTAVALPGRRRSSRSRTSRCARWRAPSTRPGSPRPFASCDAAAARSPSRRAAPASRASPARRPRDRSPPGASPRSSRSLRAASASATLAVRETTLVRRVLVALPRLRWLDDRMRWFSFTGERSPLGKTVERLFADADAIPIDVLVAALAASSVSARRTPPPVLTRYLSEISACDIVDGEVRQQRNDVSPRPRPETG